MHSQEKITREQFINWLRANPDKYNKLMFLNTSRDVIASIEDTEDMQGSGAYSTNEMIRYIQVKMNYKFIVEFQIDPPMMISQLHKAEIK